MQLKSLPKDLVVEVLDYLADYEKLEGLGCLLEGEFTILDVRSALREIAHGFRKELAEDKGEKSTMKFRKDENLTPQVRELLSILAPTDERKLLTSFGLLDF